MSDLVKLQRRSALGALSSLLLSLVVGCRKGVESDGLAPGLSPRAAPSSPAPSTEKKPAEAPFSPETNAAPNPTEAPEIRRIYLQSLGPPLAETELAFLKKVLASFYDVRVDELPARPLPEDAFYRPRSRYRAEKLLDHLHALAPSDARAVIGLVSVDISTTKDEYEDWGILGLATLDGRECVISRFRAKKSARNDAHTRERLGKTLVHEVGHALGLPHCPSRGCLMEDAGGTVLTTDREYDLCSDCRARLGSIARPRGSFEIPWEKPRDL